MYCASTGAASARFGQRYGDYHFHVAIQPQPDTNLFMPWWPGALAQRHELFGRGRVTVAGWDVIDRN